MYVLTRDHADELRSLTQVPPNTRAHLYRQHMRVRSYVLHCSRPRRSARGRAEMSSITRTIVHAKSVRSRQSSKPNRPRISKITCSARVQLGDTCARMMTAIRCRMHRRYMCTRVRRCIHSYALGAPCSLGGSPLPPRLDTMCSVPPGSPERSLSRRDAGCGLDRSE